MAKQNFIPCPGSEACQKTAALGTTTSSGEIVINTNATFRINATRDITIKFGNSGMSAATATDFRIPANTDQVWDMGNTFDRIRVFNLDGSNAADIYVFRVQTS